MAFYALYKWYSPWSKRGYPNMIVWYRRKLFEEWFNALPPEKQQVYQRKKEAKSKRVMSALLCMNIMLDSISRKTGFDYRGLI